MGFGGELCVFKVFKRIRAHEWRVFSSHSSKEVATLYKSSQLRINYILYWILIILEVDELLVAFPFDLLYDSIIFLMLINQTFLMLYVTIAQSRWVLFSSFTLLLVDVGFTSAGAYTIIDLRNLSVICCLLGLLKMSWWRQHRWHNILELWIIGILLIILRVGKMLLIRVEERFVGWAHANELLPFTIIPRLLLRLLLFLCLIIMLYGFFGVAERSMLPHLIHRPTQARCIVHRILLPQFDSAFIMFIELIRLCIHHRIHSIEAGLYLFSLKALVFF